MEDLRPPVFGLSEDAPPSPCVKICTLDAQGACVGCGRTLEEISAWVTLTPAQKRQVVEKAQARLGREA